MKRNRGCQSDFTIKDEELDVFPEIRFEITNFRPARLAPACSNPSSAAFSDPGDPAEYDVEKVILTINGKEIEITGDAKDAIIEAVDCRLDNKIENIGFMAIQEAAIDAAVYKYDDMMMHKKGA